MSIQELGSIGEFIASIAVLVTLVVLVLETRQNTAAIRSSNARHTATQQANSLGNMLKQDVAPLMLKAYESLDDLTAVERYRFDLALTIWLQSIEQAYRDYREGSFPADSLAPYESSIPAFLGTPGGSAWWQERQVWFSREFREDVKRLIEGAGRESETAGPLFEARRPREPTS